MDGPHSPPDLSTEPNQAVTPRSQVVPQRIYSSGTLRPSSRSPVGGCHVPELAPTAISTVVPTGILTGTVWHLRAKNVLIESLLNGHAPCPCLNTSPGGLRKHHVRPAPPPIGPKKPREARVVSLGKGMEPWPPLGVIPVFVPSLVTVEGLLLLEEGRTRVLTGASPRAPGPWSRNRQVPGWTRQ